MYIIINIKWYVEQLTFTGSQKCILIRRSVYFFFSLNSSNQSLSQYLFVVIDYSKWAQKSPAFQNVSDALFSAEYFNIIQHKITLLRINDTMSEKFNFAKKCIYLIETLL